MVQHVHCRKRKEKKKERIKRGGQKGKKETRKKLHGVSLQKYC